MPTQASDPPSKKPARLDAVGDRGRMSWIDRQRPVIAAERFGEALILDAGVAAVDQGREVCRIGRERAVKTRQRLVKAVELQ